MEKKIAILISGNIRIFEQNKNFINKILSKFKCFYFAAIWENQKKFVVILTLANLQINLLTHTFVPTHIKLTPTEKNELYKKYNIQNDAQIPEISRFDPVAKSILLRPGEVCKILRYDKISLQNEYYRICIS
jgi:DNA-directed RNA polymerase subunit H (RpoH/RPB5)